MKNQNRKENSIMPKKKLKCDLCTQQISIRCTERQKQQIKDLSKEKGIRQKDFILNCINESVEKEKKNAQKEINLIACVCNVQELVNYLRESQKEDSYIEEVCKKLWDLVN